uniref:LysM peptidoglycan-binding domain-containing protein n=2 Tax=Bellilinea TaxID=475960 RepID=A0A7C4KYK3_9CHLR
MGNFRLNDIIETRMNAVFRRRWLTASLLLGGLIFLLSLSLIQPSASQAQVLYFTPTPNENGQIFYTVKEGDTCISVSLLNQVSLDDLRRLNNLDAACVLITGSKLLLGTVEPQPTSAVLPTETPVLPSPTPFRGTGRVCIVLFNDVNGNALAEEGESAIPGGAVSITDRLGRVSLTGETSPSLEEPACFDNLEEGEYNISVAIPQGYNPTTLLNYALKVSAGDNSVLDFGAQLSSQAVPTPVSEGGRSPLMAVMGGIILLAGLGLAVYARLLTRK